MPTYEESKVRERWYSDRLRREITLVRWGHFGQPLLLFPTAGGDAEEVERMWLVKALAPFIEAGKLKVYACDSAAGRALLDQEGSPQHQMWVQDQFHRCVRHEIVPAIHADCREDQLKIWTAGASIGAFNAVAVLCRFPDVFSRAVGLSGTYDLRRFYKTPSNTFTDHFWVSSPLHFVPTLSGPHLDALRQCYIMLMSGEGRAEDIGESWALAHVLGQRRIPNFVDSWGAEWHHDWPTWRTMLPKLMGQWLQG